MPQKFDDMVDSVLDSLIKQFPKQDKDKLKSRAYAIAVKNWKMKYGKLPTEEDASEKLDFEKLLKESKKYDERGFVIIAENVPLIFEATISVVKE